MRYFPSAARQMTEPAGLASTNCWSAAVTSVAPLASIDGVRVHAPAGLVPNARGVGAAADGEGVGVGSAPVGDAARHEAGARNEASGRNERRRRQAVRPAVETGADRLCVIRRS